MAKLKLHTGTVAKVSQSGDMTMQNGDFVHAALIKAKTNKVGDVVSYVATPSYVTKRFQAGRTQWLDSVPQGPMFFKQCA